MSRLIRYEIEIAGITPTSDIDTIAALRAALSGEFSPDNEYRADDGSMVILYGEENDWARDHSERNDRVVEAVRTVFPEARVQTRWLDMETVDWDASFDTEEDPT